MSHTWEELKEEYSNDQFPPFGGPFTDALDVWEWLSKNFDPPKRTEETKIKVTVKKDSEMVKMVNTMKAEKQDFKNRVESGEFSNSDKNKTAVEWLVDKVTDMIHESNHIELVSLLEQAKQMEKAQIIKSNRDGVDMVVNKQPFITGEEYYKETYGS